MSSFASDSFDTDSFDTDSFLFDVLRAIVVPGGGGSSAPTVIETKQRDYPKATPKKVQDDQDLIDLCCVVVQYLNT